MLWTPYVNTFKGVITNLTGRPSSTWGTSITPGNNSFPAYVEILPDTAYMCCFLEVIAHSNFVAANARDTLLTLGFDFSGGTTYTDMEITNLLVSCVSTFSAGFGVGYQFPLLIPAGTAIAAKASINNATVGTLLVGIRLYGRPTRPELVRCGRSVTTYGATTASSSGTVVTPGTTSEGAWTELTPGSNTTKPHFFWQTGVGINDSTISVDRIYGHDLSYGDATNKEIISEDECISSVSSNEQMGRWLRPTIAHYCETPSGVRVYGRMQGSGALDSNLSMCAYGVT